MASPDDATPLEAEDPRGEDLRESSSATSYTTPQYTTPQYTPREPERAYGDIQNVMVRAINDSAVDRLETAPLAGALVEVLTFVEPPTCVGLLAKWGSGKSFLLHHLKRQFDPYARETSTGQLVQWFEEARDGRDAYEKLPPSEAEREAEIFEQRISRRAPCVVVEDEYKAPEWFPPIKAACLRTSIENEWTEPLKWAEPLMNPDASEYLNDEQRDWIKRYVSIKVPSRTFKGFLAWLLLPFFFCFKLCGKSWEALKPYWVDTVWNILLDAWRTTVWNQSTSESGAPAIEEMPRRSRYRGDAASMA